MKLDHLLRESYARRLSAALVGAMGVLAGAHTPVSGALVQQPIGVSGFNGDTIIDAAASNPSGHNFGTVGGQSGAIYTSSTGIETSDINSPGTGAYANTGYVHNQEEFFQNGWNSLTTGLPANGVVTSLTTNPAGTHTVFNLGYNGTATDFADNNTLYFTTSTAHTLMLTTPISAASLDFLAAADLPKGYTYRTQFDVTLNFSDGTTSTYTQGITAGPLGDNGAAASSNKAITGLYGAENGNSPNHSTVFGGGGYMTESDITLSPADQLETITSITFTPNVLSTEGGQNNPAGIYAISGEVLVPEPASMGIVMMGAVALLGRRKKAK